MFQITDLPSELLSLILKEVVLSDGDTAYLKLSLVCKKFQCIITREGFKKGCHFDWLLSKHIFFVTMPLSWQCPGH